MYRRMIPPSIQRSFQQWWPRSLLRWRTLPERPSHRLRTNWSCCDCRTLRRRKQDRPPPSPGAGLCSSVMSLVPLLCCWLGNFDFRIWLDVRSVELVGDERSGREILRGGQAGHQNDELGANLAKAVDDAAGHEEDDDDEDDAVEDPGLRTLELS